MKKQILLSLVAATSVFALACSGDNSTNDGGTDSGPVDSGNPDVAKTDSGSDASTFPAPPTLKTQVDRLGRPAANTALNNVFNPTASTKGTAKDAYNADKNVAGWPAAYTAEFAKNLAIFDSLDTVCGNQPGFAIANTYNTLAGVLADDRLYVNTAASTCAQYLAVELTATTLGSFPTDCGGRTLTYDVIDTTYGAVSGVGLGGVPDGIAKVASKTSGTTFPYLAAPQ